ncbi:MAG: hypothetical protein RR646_03960 [Erysipelotrichaceae bacterium]
MSTDNCKSGATNTSSGVINKTINYHVHKSGPTITSSGGINVPIDYYAHRKGRIFTYEENNLTSITNKISQLVVKQNATLSLSTTILNTMKESQTWKGKSKNEFVAYLDLTVQYHGALVNSGLSREKELTFNYFIYESLKDPFNQDRQKTGPYRRRLNGYVQKDISECPLLGLNEAFTELNELVDGFWNTSEVMRRLNKNG